MHSWCCSEIISKKGEALQAQRHQEHEGSWFVQKHFQQFKP